MESAHLIEGIIAAAFLGLVFGNFATNPIYRLPRKESLFLKDPYCGDCNAKLMPKDLFPVLSWLMTRGKCRYCGALVPATYACTEAFIGLLFVAAYLKSGFTEQFLLVSFGMTALVMIAMMLYLDNFFSGKTVIAAIVLGALYRTLQDGTLYGMAGGGFAGLMVGALVWKYSGKNLIRDITAFPEYLNLLVTAGVWLPLHQFYMTCLVAAVALLFKKNRPWIVEWSIITYVIIAVLIDLQ
jgi:prepilin signal peptidase PulO-like enzyme (type II secretory pathway)